MKAESAPLSRELHSLGTCSINKVSSPEMDNLMQARFKVSAAAAALALCGLAVQAQAEGAASTGIAVQMKMVDDKGVGTPVGQVTIKETQYGVVFTPSLTGLPQGIHGFHVHENPSCEPKEQDGKRVPALAAGGHYDPAGTKRHGLPWGEGHLGDLPALFVDAAGNANNPVLAPRLKLADVRGRSLMIHAGGDNHADHPAPLGGGGARIVCGVI
jgi:superoxide dismutase, Cu-Zn family